ncbi:MAG: DUF981 family protein [Fervidicoccus sp.]
MLVAYAMLRMAMGQDIKTVLKGLYAPLLAMRVYVFFSGLYGYFIWPLPGSYDILFYDMYAVLGVGLIAIALCIKHDTKLEYIGFLALIYGVITIFYGYSGYSLGMTKEPAGMFALYALVGLSSIVFYFVSFGIDSGKVNKPLLYIEALLLILGGLAAAYIAGSAVPSHLKMFGQYVPFI